MGMLCLFDQIYKISGFFSRELNEAIESDESTDSAWDSLLDPRSITPVDMARTKRNRKRLNQRHPVRMEVSFFILVIHFYDKVI